MLIASIVKLFILHLNLKCLINLYFLGEAESVAGDSPLSLKNLSPRHQVFLELYQTEFNYVSTLNTIMTVSKIFMSLCIKNSHKLVIGKLK